MGYKINRQKSVEILYTNNEISGKESKKTIPFEITSKKEKGINLTNEVKDLYAENYKTFKKMERYPLLLD